MASYFPKRMGGLIDEAQQFVFTTFVTHFLVPRGPATRWRDNRLSQLANTQANVGFSFLASFFRAVTIVGFETFSLRGQCGLPTLPAIESFFFAVSEFLREESI